MHIPVMKQEVVDLLRVKDGGVYIDCTFGQGGHTLELLKKNAIVIAIDRDPLTKIYADKIKTEFPDRFFWVNDVFSNIKNVWKEFLDPMRIDGILFDFGFSSNQIEDKLRGFSFLYQSNLDMRYNANENILTALDVINKLSQDDLANIFFKYGEEKLAKKFAKAIVEYRKNKRIENCYEFLTVCKKNCKFNSNRHFATKIFQALRIYVNDELFHIEKALKDSLTLVKYYGRIVTLTFHSLEDRIVKNIFNNKNIQACSKEESKKNYRARSAKIRWLVKTKEEKDA